MNIRLILSLIIAFGLTMGWTVTAQAAKVVTRVTVNAQVGTLVYGTSAPATFPVTLNTSSGLSAIVTVTPTVSGLPAGATYSFNPPSADAAKGTHSYDLILTITTSASTPAGTSTFTVTAEGINGAGTLTIGQRALLTISATGVDKVYDGTTTAAVILSDNRVAGDQLTTSYTGATFVDANVGTAKQVSVTGITFSGPAAVNYIAANTTATTTANITKATASVTLGNLGQVWDGTAEERHRDDGPRRS